MFAKLSGDCECNELKKRGVKKRPAKFINEVRIEADEGTAQHVFTFATGYIFSFGLSRRRHEPPFKPGGSVGALVGRPGFRAGFARIRARGRGRGSVGAACSSRKKPLDLQSSYHLITL